jgi:YegS/Rv2252/BmrU family lipid kinase
VATQLLSEGFDVIIAVGGDGTINEVVNGWFDNGRAVNPQATMAIVPIGTGGDFRRSIGIAGPEDAIELILSREEHAIDVGKVTFQSGSGETRSRYFANLVSFGMGGEVAARVKNWLSPISGKLAFQWATLEVFFSYQPKTIELEIDGQQSMHRITNIAVGNGRYHGGGMHVCPLATLNNGQLEVTVIDALSMFELARDMRVLYSDNLYIHPKAHQYRGRRIVARSSETVAIEVDGEPLGTLPLELTILPTALKLAMRG